MFRSSIGVHAKLIALSHTFRIETLRIDAVLASVLAGAIPCDNEVPIGIHGNRGELLRVRGGGVDSELSAQRQPNRIEPACIDPMATSILRNALPGNDEVTGRIHGYSGISLRSGDRRVDTKFRALRYARRVIALSIDAGKRAILPRTVPDHDGVSIRIHGSGWIGLAVGREGIDAELAAQGSDCHERASLKLFKAQNETSPRQLALCMLAARNTRWTRMDHDKLFSCQGMRLRTRDGRPCVSETVEG